MKTIPASPGLYPSERRGLGVEAMHGKCQLLEQTARQELLISNIDCGSSFIVPSVRSGPGNTARLQAGRKPHGLALRAGFILSKRLI